MRRWKRGDVALLSIDPDRDRRTDGDGLVIGVRDNVGSWAVGAAIGRQVKDRDVRSARPLVVIDPEDSEQARRLDRAIRDAYGKNKAGWDAAADITNMQAALRSLIAPPKPEKPRGWGAVVEDDTGAYWTLIAPEADDWRNHVEGSAHWRDIAAVRVVSEGVTS